MIRAGNLKKNLSQLLLNSKTYSENVKDLYCKNNLYNSYFRYTESCIFKHAWALGKNYVYCNIWGKKQTVIISQFYD